MGQNTESQNKDVKDQKSGRMDYNDLAGFLNKIYKDRSRKKEKEDQIILKELISATGGKSLIIENVRQK